MKFLNVQAHLYLSGTVQGVGMRFFIRSQAVKFSLSGFARNLEDGRVEALLQGKKEDVEAVIEKIEKGDCPGMIQDIQISWEDLSSKLERFEIRAS